MLHLHSALDHAGSFTGCLHTCPSDSDSADHVDVALCALLGCLGLMGLLILSPVAEWYFLYSADLRQTDDVSMRTLAAYIAVGAGPGMVCWPLLGMTVKVFMGVQEAAVC